MLQFTLFLLTSNSRIDRFFQRHHILSRHASGHFSVQLFPPERDRFFAAPYTHGRNKTGPADGAPAEIADHISVHRDAPLSSTVAVLHDRLHCRTTIDEQNINRVSRIVETYTGIRIPANRPIRHPANRLLRLLYLICTLSSIRLKLRSRAD